MRTYSELITIPTFNERLEYLRLKGAVGSATFGFDRYLNQALYHSTDWRRLRREIIIRDHACDLGLDGFELDNGIYIHHMNPVTEQDILARADCIMDPEYLICASFRTHNAIHFGRDVSELNTIVERTPYDTCPWRKT